MIEVDVETTGLQWYAHELFLVQFLLPNERKARVLKHPFDRDEIQRLLSFDEGYRAWNAKFDLHFLKSAGYTLPDPKHWHDGMVLAQIMDERVSSALKARGEMMFGPAARDPEVQLKEYLAEETKRRRKHSKETGELMVRPDYSDVPDEIMFPYAAGDVELQREVCETLEQRMPADLKPVYDLEMEVLGMLFDVERRGIFIDIEAAEAFEHQLEDDLDRLNEEAVDLAGVGTFNPGSGAQLGEALQRRGADLTFARTLKNGLPSTDEETLKALDDDLAEKVLELRSTEKLYSTYVHPMLHTTERSQMLRAPYIAEDGRLHPNFRQVGARTGRMSASDPNVQNWHRDDLRLRHLVIPSDGNLLVSSDLDAIEMRLLGAFTGEGPVYEMIHSGADLHAHTAKMIGLKDYDRGGGVIEPARQRGKTFNYSMIFGAGIRSIRKHYRVSQNTAKDYIFRYREAYPEIVEFQNRIEATLEDIGYVKTPLGRRQRVRDIRFVDREAYKFVNYLIQGTAADIIKEAAVASWKAGVPMVSIVHDELLGDVPAGDAEEAARIFNEALVDQPAITEVVPLDVEAKIVERWSYAKDKGFEPDYLARK